MKIILAALLVVAFIARLVSADEAGDRFKAAQERLAAKQRETEAARARATTLPIAPGTQPAGKAARVVFIIDARESLAKRQDDIKKQVLLGIGELSPDQRFGVVVASDAHVSTWEPAPSAATPENADRAWQFIQKINFTGPSRATLAFPAAQKLHPDVIWFISNAASGLDTGEEIVAAAKKSGCKVNTVLHYTAKDEAEERETLRQIAKATGGICINEKGEVEKAAPPSKPAPPKPSGTSIFQPAGR